MERREHWGSILGFIFATVGAAIGLGNIWRFPTTVGREGGGAFVLVYLAVVLAVGLPAMLGELTIGRRAQRNAIGAFQAIRPGGPWWVVGAFGVLASFIIISFYTVIAGWSLAYFFLGLTGGLTGLDPQGLSATFDALVSDPIRPVLWHLAFMAITAAVVLFGVKQGIERWAKVLMPGIFIVLLILFVRVITLPGAVDGAIWFLRPDFAQLGWRTLLTATGQVFFSFSLGVGVMITYGSYLGREANLARSAVIIGAIDVLVALLAGLTIIPAVFALGISPETGPGLLFITLPGVFGQLPFGGQFFGTIFFVMLSFAALTSTVSMLEVIVAYLVDEKRLGRVAATLLTATAAFLLGVPAAMAEGPLADWRILGLDFLSLLDFTTANVLLPLGGLLTALFVGWVWGVDRAILEISQGGTRQGLWTWGLAVRYVVPVALAVVLVTGWLGMR